MTLKDIAHHRLHSQQIGGTKFTTPEEIVAWLGAVQAQDYAAAKWAIGLRLPSCTEMDIEQAIANKTIVRTWPMRGTLHFMAAADARWLLKLLAPRIIARSAGQYKQYGLNESVFSKSKDLFEKVMQGGKQLVRNELYKALENAGISTGGQRGLHILGHHAQQGLICLSAREGKQHRFALLDEWLPTSKAFERDEALAELSKRYFTGHGPATLQDFVWWTGLTVQDAKTAIEMVKTQLLEKVVEGQTYFMPQTLPSVNTSSKSTYLLPAFDEYLLGYKDRSAVVDPANFKQVATLNGIFNATIVIDSKAVGAWKRIIKKDTVIIETCPFVELSNSQKQAIANEAERYGKFIDLQTIMV